MRTFTSPVKYQALLAVAFWLVVWHVASRMIDNAILLVSPAQTFGRLFEMAAQRHFWQTISFSLIRIISGFILAIVVGVAIASLSSRSKALYTLFLPAFNTIKAVPVASFTILALMWLNASNLSVFIAFVTVLPIIYFNTYEGIKNTDLKLVEMSRVFRISVFKMIRFVYFPAVLPYVVSAAASGLGFAFKAGVAAELIGFARSTIGFSLQQARTHLQTADMLAWTIAIVLLSYIMEKIFLLCLRRVEKWQSN